MSDRNPPGERALRVLLLLAWCILGPLLGYAFGPERACWMLWGWVLGWLGYDCWRAAP